MCIGLSYMAKVVVTLLIIIVTIVRDECASQLILKKGVPLVKLEQGYYIGIIRGSREGKHYHAFEGLRYANPPKRFQPPEPISIPEGMHHEAERAFTAPPKCSQELGGQFIGQEDCLFLSVFVPMRTSPTKDGFSVMLWIHGGAFKYGSGSEYEPEYLMDEDIILITINYRLGAFGFLSTEDNVAAGNMGLKDQVQALKWIQTNVNKFGGDPKRVTIAGCSAGGASVHYLMLSPLAKGLFHNAIVGSGSASNFWAFNPKFEALSRAKELANHLQCPVDTSAALIECLNSKTMQEILSAQSKLSIWLGSPDVPFSVTLDMIFLTDTPDNIMKRKDFTKVPMIAGVTQDEGLSIKSASVMYSEKHRKELDSDFLKIAPITFNYKGWFPQEHLDQVSTEIREFYFGDKSIDMDVMQNLTNLYSDANFVYGVWKLILSHATEKPVYPYIFSFIDDESSSSLTQLFSDHNELLGVAHGDELQYLFRLRSYFPKEFPKGSKSEAFSKRLVKLWASFVQHRIPKETWGSKWPSISKAQLNGDKPYLWYRLDEVTEIVENPFMSRIKFWNQILKRYKQEDKQEYIKNEL